MIIKYDRVSFSICLRTAGCFFQESITKEDILKGDIPRTPLLQILAIIVPVGKTIHDAETFYVVVEGQVVINGVEIIEALFLTYSQFYIFNIEYYQDNIASWQFIQHVIAENKDGKVLKKVITLTQKL
jgi:hypothetical protein